jgi:hypothetical protein
MLTCIEYFFFLRIVVEGKDANKRFCEGFFSLTKVSWVSLKPQKLLLFPYQNKFQHCFSGFNETDQIAETASVVTLKPQEKIIDMSYFKFSVIFIVFFKWRHCYCPVFVAKKNISSSKTVLFFFTSLQNELQKTLKYEMKDEK